MGERDDFPRDVIRKLGERVNLHCSNSGCRAPTKGPHTEPDKVVNIGKAAHINAAAPGGKRFDPNQTSDERSSFANGIWLCSDCATLIDTDENKYTADLLRFWKSGAEAEALARIGQPALPPSMPSAEKVGLDALVMSKPHVGGVAIAMRLAARETGDVIEALAFGYGAIPKLTFDLTNVGTLDIRLCDLFVDVVEFIEGDVQDVWIFYGLGRVVRKYRCHLSPKPGRYRCEPIEDGEDTYLALTPGELEAFKIELGLERQIGIYRISVSIGFSVGGEHFVKTSDQLAPFGVYDPQTHPPVKDARRGGPPKSLR